MTGTGCVALADEEEASVREWYRTWSPGENILGLK